MIEILTVGALIALVKLTYDISRDAGSWYIADRAAKRKAASALSVAVSSTEAYLKHLQDGGERKEFHENHLTALWDQAATDLLPVVGNDKAKVEPLEFKAQYWEDPKAWSAADIEATKIKLSQIREALKQYLQ